MGPVGSFESIQLYPAASGPPEEAPADPGARATRVAAKKSVRTMDGDMAGGTLGRLRA